MRNNLKYVFEVRLINAWLYKILNIPANREYSQTFANIQVLLKYKHSSSNVNKMFVQSYLVFNDVAQKHYSYIVHDT